MSDSSIVIDVGDTQAVSERVVAEEGSEALEILPLMR